MEMETNDDNTNKRTGDAQGQGESSAKRLKCSIEVEAFCCDVCTKPLRPPIFQCTEGHIFCSSCCNKMPEEECGLSSGCTGTIARSLGMEHAVQSILVDCCHAEHGCAEKTAYYDNYKHKVLCKLAPCKCPEPGCCFAGRVAEFLDHLTTHHKWSSMPFQYWVPFDLRIVEPGSHVLHCRNDGQLYLLSVQPAAEPNGLAVSLVCVQYKSAAVGCSVSFSLSPHHCSTSTLDDLWPWWHLGWPPKEYICFVPKVSDGSDDAGIVLTINITSVDAADENDDPDDSSYVETDDDDDDDSSS
ncbi:unnamed protein product [Urochloa humidicola]